MENREIWSAFLEGNRFAFEVLLRKYYSALHNYGSYYQPDKEILSDEIHDLMLSLWEKRERLSVTDNPKLYLFKALKHQILRNKQRRITHVDIEDYNENVGTSETNHSFIEIEHIEQRRQTIQHTLTKLTPRQREVLHLRFFEDLNNDQIAQVMDISKEAVANLLSLSLRTFKVFWKAEYLIWLLIFIKTLK